MPFQKRTNPNFPLDGIQTFVTADGLDEFIKILEKDFFAEVNVKCRYHTGKRKTELILDLYCNFGLTESLHHFNNGNWGGFVCNSDDQKITSSFDAAFETLSFKNNSSIDVAELSLHFRDTSIVITRIRDYSITEQLGNIVNMLSEHFVYFTKGLTEMPYEIFVPVFEENSQSPANQDTEYSYFDHWGLYFEDDAEHNVMVYTLESKQLRKEAFFLLD